MKWVRESHSTKTVISPKGSHVQHGDLIKRREKNGSRKSSEEMTE